jgi:hypothetical protein
MDAVFLDHYSSRKRRKPAIPHAALTPEMFDAAMGVKK